MPLSVDSQGNGHDPDRRAVIAIHDIQGAGHVSPLDNDTLTTSGIVTALRTGGTRRGFYIQDPVPDADEATSEGIFVNTGGSSTPASLVTVGDLVIVNGRVNEFRAGGATSANLTITGAHRSGHRIGDGRAAPASGNGDWQRRPHPADGHD